MLDPIHISADSVIISGHRRTFCARRAGLAHIPAIRHPNVSYRGNKAAFLRLLVEVNSQRKKSAAMLIREGAIKVDPKAAHAQLLRDRKEAEDERRHRSELVTWWSSTMRRSTSASLLALVAQEEESRR